MAELSLRRLSVLGTVAALSAALPPASPGRQLALCVPLVAVAGLPHGAHDWALARSLSRPGIALFAALYGGLGAIAALIAYAAPPLALLAFIVLGIAHFGGEDAAALNLPPTPLVRAALGTLPILGPAAFWPGQTAALLHSLRIPLAPAAVQAVGLAALAAACALLAAALARHPPRRRPLLREQTALLLLTAAAPPILSFTAYFCLVHAPRHSAALPPALRSWAAAPVTAAAIILIACPIAFLALRLGEGWAWAATNALFWGLASLAWPHAAFASLANRTSGPAHNQDYAT